MSGIDPCSNHWTKLPFRVVHTYREDTGSLIQRRWSCSGPSRQLVEITRAKIKKMERLHCAGYRYKSAASYIFIHPHHSFSLFAPLAQSLKTFFLNFPVLVFGSSSNTSISLGTINLEISLFSFAH